MRFRLIYQGELKSRQSDPTTGQRDRLAGHKQDIRKEFHLQLKHLWSTNKFLRDHKIQVSNRVTSQPIAKTFDRLEIWDDQPIPMVDHIANQYRENGYRFVPLVRKELSLLCSLNILFLRRDIPGSVLSAGDLDNRVKTLVDTLRRPKSANELQGNETPGADEDPFFVLLEDDDLVSQISVETDTLLIPPSGNADADRRQVCLVITVELKPYDVTMFNLSFS
ncbi:hypothetical protein AB8A31_10780 [Tardiphaga sp. 804_B3_N1_9]|jgi:hypothetical protein|uniref:hypothetical protein n=1 Tax=Tardiphaga TaxID=1395974 RepID=UPI00158665BC|nr:hypothetical protein [Tardiphaga robiniae]NUU42891.1 hypothetical protein [Tardiphaga robiniae]